MWVAMVTNSPDLLLAHKMLQAGLTVADFCLYSDLHIFLSSGKLVEFDKPSNLIANKDSAFAKLVAEYWSHYRRN